MIAGTRTFRVYVTSTFEDLKDERDALHREVFPRLRAFCESRNTRFHPIDMRWGVRDDAARTQQTTEICLREIASVQQAGRGGFFVAIIGDRYGWRPLPFRIPAREFETVLSFIPDEAQRAVVNEWYDCDKNAVPPEFVLRPRTGEFLDHNSWLSIEGRLLRILGQAARAAGLREEAQMKYAASWFHQELVRGLGKSEEDAKRVFAFIRTSPAESQDPDLHNIKRLLRQRLGANVTEFIAGDLDQFCREVTSRLERAIEAEIVALAPATALDDEILYHDLVANEGSRTFVGREATLHAISSYLRSGEERPMVLLGNSGAGKSATMAIASEQARASMPSAAVIRRFIGASPDSFSELFLLRSLSQQVCRSYKEGGDLPVDISDPIKLFSETVALASPERPLVLFCDGIDRVQGFNAHEPVWLGPRLSPNTKIVLSMTALPPALNTACVAVLGPMPMPDAAVVLDRWLMDAGRMLSPIQREKLLEKFAACGEPLYLKLAFEEACHWHSADQLGSCMLGDGLPGLMNTFLKRLALDHGEVLVSRSLGYLAASDYGLTENELLDILSGDSYVWDEFLMHAHFQPPQRRLPIVVWSRLYCDLEPYLTDRSAPGRQVITFRHHQFQEVASERFEFVKHDAPRILHPYLAGLYYKLLFADGRLVQLRNPDPRALKYLPYHAREGRCMAQWLNAVTDFAYLSSVVALVDVGIGRTSRGRWTRWNDGYFLISDELDRWLREFPEETGHELIVRLRQVWRKNGVEFVKAASDIMPALYRDLSALDAAPPEEVLDRERHHFVMEGGPLWTWCQRERLKYETKSPWPSVVAPRVLGSSEIFISYRREGGAETARLIRKELEDRGYRTFLDVENLRSKFFDERLLHEIESRPHFVVILSPGCLDRCDKPNDWFRRELAHAMATGRNIIPVLKDGFRFPDKRNLPVDISELVRYNCVEYSHKYFAATIAQIVRFLDETPQSGLAREPEPH